MSFKVDVLFSGFSGKLPFCSHGWGTWALVRDGKHNILLDTGCVGLRLNYDKILAEHGLTRNDIDIVLLTHMHFDHACNVDLLPNAEFILSEKEWEHANNMKHRDLFIQESAIIPIRNSKKRFITKDDEEIVPGITSLMTPGHTPGSISFVLHQDNGEKWILAGDAVKNRGELITGEVQMSLDIEATNNSLKKIRNLGDRVLPGHDGWLKIVSGEVFPEGNNDVTLLFGQGITVNNGKTSITIHMD